MEIPCWEPFRNKDPDWSKALTTGTGVKLLFIKSLTKKAFDKGLKDVRVFVSLHPDGTKEYLICEGQNPVYTDTSFEGLCCHIDIMALAKE